MFTVMKNKLLSTMHYCIAHSNITIIISLFSFLIMFTGCYSSSVRNNPADNPSSDVPGVIRIVGSEGNAPGQFISPESVVLDQALNFYVVDSFNDRIQKFDSSGRLITSWGSNGDGDGQFMGCRGITIDSDNMVYVTDVILNRVQKFDSSGRFITKWGIEGTGKGQFSEPFDIAADPANNIYVVDSSNHRVQKFDSDGTHLATFGTPGTGDGQFDQPSCIAIHRDGHIYVGDGSNNRIQKFDRNMNFITKWGKTGTGDGEFDLPYGISTDSAGNVYIADIGNSRIQKFDSSGNFLGKAGQKGSQGREFNEPADIDIDQYGNLYVIDESNHRLQLLYQAVFTINAAAEGRSLESTDIIAPISSKKSWMKDLGEFSNGLFGVMPLTEIAIPGTHDAGTYAITVSSEMADDGHPNGPKYVTDVTASVSSWCHNTKWTPHKLCVKIDELKNNDIDPLATFIGKSIQAPWSVSQDQSILEQLNGGIRFFDLRVQAYMGGFYVVHSMISVNMAEVLDQIVAFCKQPESSKEVILVAFKKYQMSTKDLDDQLISLIKTKLVNSRGESLLISRTDDPSTVTLNSAWEGSGRVIIFYSGTSGDHNKVMKDHTELWYKNDEDGNDPEENLTTLVNYWPNKPNTGDLLSILPEKRSEFFNKQGINGKKFFYVSQFVRTPGGNAILEGIETALFNKFTKKMNCVIRYMFKKIWKALHLSTNAEGNLLDWGSVTNTDMGKFFTAMEPIHNIVIVDHYEVAPVYYVDQVISYNTLWAPTY